MANTSHKCLPNPALLSAPKKHNHLSEYIHILLQQFLAHSKYMVILAYRIDQAHSLLHYQYLFHMFYKNANAPNFQKHLQHFCPLIIIKNIYN